MRRKFKLPTLRGSGPRNVLYLMSGSGGAQALSLLCYPAITRLYGPGEFGQFAAVVAAAALIQPVLALTYELALPLTRTRAETERLFWLSILAACVTLIVLFAANFLFAKDILPMLNVTDGASLYVLCFLSLAAVQQPLHQLAVRATRFRSISRSFLVEAAVSNALRVVAGYWLPTAQSLLIATLSAGLARIIVLGRPARHSDLSVRGFKRCLRAAGLLGVARKYVDYPMYKAPQMLLNSASASIPILVIAAFYSQRDAGLFSLARVVLLAPAGLVATAVGQVFLSEIAAATRAGTAVMRKLLVATFGLAMLCLPAFAIGLFTVPHIFSLVFGSSWQESGSFAQVLLVGVVSSLIHSPAAVAVGPLRVQRAALALEVVGLLLRLGGMFVGVMILENKLAALLFFSIGGCAYNLAVIALVFRAASRHDGAILLRRQDFAAAESRRIRIPDGGDGGAGL